MAITILQSSRLRSSNAQEISREVLVDSASDLASIPADTAPGSIAYTADMTSMWMLNNSGVWKKIGGGS